MRWVSWVAAAGAMSGVLMPPHNGGWVWWELLCVLLFCLNVALFVRQSNSNGPEAR